MSDADLRREMGERGHGFAVAEYTWRVAAQRHRDLFCSCVVARKA